MAYGRNGRPWRQNGRRATGQHKRSAPDHAAVKAIYAVLQADHHLFLVKRDLDSPEHKIFKGKVVELNKYIKTAGEKNDPQYLANKIAINRQWQIAQLENSKEHFETMRDSNLADLKSKKLEQNKLSEFFKIAVDWAKESFGRKFTRRDFEEGRALILNQSTEAAPAPAAPAPQQNPARSNTSAGTRANAQVFAENNAKKAFAEVAKKQAEQANTRQPVPQVDENAIDQATSHLFNYVSLLEKAQQAATHTAAPPPPAPGTDARPKPTPRPEQAKTSQNPKTQQGAQPAATDQAASTSTGTETRPPPAPKPHISEATASMEVDTPSGKKRAASPDGTPDSEERTRNLGKKPNFTQITPPPPPNFDKSPAPEKSASKIPIPASKSPRSPELPPAKNGASTSQIPRENGSRFRVLATQPEPTSDFPSLVEAAKTVKRKHDPKPSTPKRKRPSRPASPVTPPEVTGETSPKRLAQNHGETAVSPGSPTLRTENGSPHGATQSDFVDTSRKYVTSEKVQKYPTLKSGNRGVNHKLIKQRWEMPRLTKNYLIIGDENLQRIEKIDNDDAQILSYPGLKFVKLRTVLEDRQIKVDDYKRDPTRNPSTGTTPQKIVLSIGSHDAASGMVKTSIESQLRALKKIFAQQFRASQIYLCPIANAAAFNDTLAEWCKKQENGHS